MYTPKLKYLKAKGLKKIIFIANKTLACKAIQYNTTLQNIYT
jgi:hypothetical protein